MNLSDHIVVLDYGRKLAEGSAAEVRANPEVIAAYLGAAV
jgi:branched-chain amino acid transport system ATP-binding protein